MAFTQARPGLADELTASSAGIAALVGYPMEPFAALVLAGLGARPEGFRARQLLVEDVYAVDLVLTMTRQHRNAVLQIAPRMMSRTFTLREAAALLRAMDRREKDVLGPPGEVDLTGRGQHLVASLARLRPTRFLDSHQGSDDINDPIGRGMETFQRVGDAIAEALSPMLTALSVDWAATQAPTLPGLPALPPVPPPSR